MKNQAECYQALLDRKTLIEDDTGVKVHLDSEDCLVDQHGKRIRMAFMKPAYWSIYEEPKQKRQLYLWAITADGERWFPANSYYENEAKLREEYTHAKHVICRKDTMIPVD